MSFKSYPYSKSIATRQTQNKYEKPSNSNNNSTSTQQSPPQIYKRNEPTEEHRQKAKAQLARSALIGYSSFIAIIIAGPIGLVAVGTAAGVGIGGATLYKKHKKRKAEKKQFNIAASKSAAVNGVLA